MEEWQSKPMHGQFLNQTKDLSSNDAWQWLQRGELKKETEGKIICAQDQALRTRYIQRAIDGTNIFPKCRKFNQKDETINHVANECLALAQNQYKKDMTQWLELCTGICARNTKCLAVISGMNISHSQ